MVAQEQTARFVNGNKWAAARVALDKDEETSEFIELSVGENGVTHKSVLLHVQEAERFAKELASLARRFQ